MSLPSQTPIPFPPFYLSADDLASGFPEGKRTISRESTHLNIPATAPVHVRCSPFCFSQLWLETLSKSSLSLCDQSYFLLSIHNCSTNILVSSPVSPVCPSPMSFFHQCTNHYNFSHLKKKEKKGENTLLVSYLSLATIPCFLLSSAAKFLQKVV